MVRIGDVLTSVGMSSTLTIIGEVGGGDCGRQFRPLGGPSAGEVLLASLPPESPGSLRNRGLVILGVGD